MNWWIVINSIFACGNFWFAGKTGDMVSLAIGIGNLLCVLIESRRHYEIS
jgi:hypothetical protein